MSQSDWIATIIQQLYWRFQTGIAVNDDGIDLESRQRMISSEGLTTFGNVRPSYKRPTLNKDHRRACELVELEAISSDMGWKIIQELATGELEEAEIGRRLEVNSYSLKPYLQDLIQAGLVSVSEKVTHPGKIVRTYSLTGGGSVNLVERNYEALSEALITGLIASLGDSVAKIVLRDVGIRIGAGISATLLTQTKATELNPDAFAELFVNSLLRNMKTYPKLISVKTDEVVFDQRRCPFEELSKKYPGIACDVLDEAVHEGMDEKLGTKTARLSCRGHGAPACRFLVKWPTPLENGRAKSRN